MSDKPLRIAPLRIALLGCGDHAHLQHAMPLARWNAEHPGKIELIAACDPIADRAAAICRDFGFAEAFTDMRQMLDRAKPDAVVSVPPVHLNASIGIELLQRRIPCSIEKPPGTSMDEVRRLADVTKQTRTPHMISMNRRFNPHLNAAVHWFRPFGPIRHIFAKMHRINRREPEFIWATGIHAIDTVCYLGGEVAESSHRIIGRAYHIDLNFKNGIDASIDIHPETTSFAESYDLVGDSHRCKVQIDESGRVQTTGWIDHNLVFSSTSGDNEPPEITSGAFAETDHFINSLLNKSRHFPTVHDVAPSAAIALAANS